LSADLKAECLQILYLFNNL